MQTKWILTVHENLTGRQTSTVLFVFNFTQLWTKCLSWLKCLFPCDEISLPPNVTCFLGNNDGSNLRQRYGVVYNKVSGVLKQTDSVLQQTIRFYEILQLTYIVWSLLVITAKLIDISLRSGLDYLQKNDKCQEEDFVFQMTYLSFP